MKFQIKVKTKSKKISVTQIDANHLQVCLTTAPTKGKANLVLIKLLANHFQIPQNKIQLISGHTSKQKIIQITP